MPDAGVAFELYGVADFALARGDLGEEERAALARWLPLNDHPDVLGWYDRAREAIGPESGPPIDELGFAREVAATGLQGFLDDGFPRARQLHALTAVMRALPDAFRQEGELRELASAVFVSIAEGSLSFEGPEIAIDLYRQGVGDMDGRRGRSVHSDEWTLLLAEVGLHDISALEDSPCEDDWTVVDDLAAVKLETTYTLTDRTLDEVRDRFLDPSRWPDCFASVWTAMDACAPGLFDGTPKNYVERVQVNGDQITACLEFARVVFGSSVALEYRIADPTAIGVECAATIGGADVGAVEMDFGYVHATDLGPDDAGVNSVRIQTMKTLRFRPPVDGMNGAMLACALGYGEVGRAMAETCSQG